ncbi:F-type H+-transporting ATPase subunit delta [Ketogulonicigenium robustum]|uniref:ATP synthase subunit delta n=1 Tax=Ketogulonicigenium robustum TaxID=92947 RepID=A0A1W6NXT8_9RHOB|nr:F-type H+-transporting ATPase subunit delta [Ketogulonicigenium robustum]
MSEPASISTGIASRYATAVFDLVMEEGALPALEADIDSLGAALSDSADLRAMISSPVVSRDDQEKAIAAVADALGLSGVLKNTLALMAEKRRLFVLPQLVAELKNRVMAAKGEVVADVVSAKALTATQATKLAEVLSAKFGKTVKLNATVDPALIGGLVVKIGSKMIDTSVASKLQALQNTMKEVG